MNAAVSPQPFFSIVIPTFNRLARLQRALRSVQEQTCNDWELILIDDGSVDGTADWVEQNVGQDHRIHYFWQKNSGLPAVARNVGIGWATGRYIAFLDSDDHWECAKLEQCREYLITHPEMIAVSHSEDLLINGVRMGELRNWREPRAGESFYENLLFDGNCLSTSAMVVARDILVGLGGFDTRPSFYIVEDYELWLRLAQSGPIGFIPQVLGAFCQDGQGISSRIDPLHRNLWEVVSHHLRCLPVEPKIRERLMRVHRARIEYYRGRTYQMAGQQWRAIPILLRSLAADPLMLKKWVALAFAVLGLRR